MPVPTINVKMSNLQNEFGGTYPISISEYYRDSSLNVATFQDAQQTVTGSQRPPEFVVNGSIPIADTIQFGNFRNTRQYQLNYINYNGTGKRVYVPPDYPNWPYGDDIFTPIGGNVSGYPRYGRAVHSFTISESAILARLRVEPVSVIIQGWFRSGGFLGDNDFSYIGNPGYRITDPAGGVVIETYAPAEPSNYNDLSLTLSAQTVILDSPGTYTMTIFAEAMYDEPREIRVLANMIWPATIITYISL